MIFNKLKLFNHQVCNYCMHYLYAIFAKFLDICKQMSGYLVNGHDNIPYCGVVPRFSDWEVIVLNMTSEVVGINSESFFFAKWQEDKNEIPTLNKSFSVFQKFRFLDD